MLLCYSDLAQQMCKNAKEIRIKTKHCFCNGFSQDKSAFAVGMWYSQVFMEMQHLCSVMYQRMALSLFIKVTLVVLSCSFVGKKYWWPCQWCHHNFLCIVISSREGGRILPKKEKKKKNTYVAESMTFFHIQFSDLYYF